MAIVEHTVSYRNGAQVMVAGLRLAQLGYRRGAKVIVRDPAGRAGHPPWEFIVSNDEHATLTSREPRPPAWIVAGVRVVIEISAPSDPMPVGSPPRRAAAPNSGEAHKEVTTATLSEWRRALVRLLARLEGDGNSDSQRGVAARISRLSDSGRVPREIAACMRVVSEMRNVAEYQAKVLDSAESAAVSAAWRAVADWADRNVEGSGHPRRSR